MDMEKNIDRLNQEMRYAVLRGPLVTSASPHPDPNSGRFQPRHMFSHNAETVG